MHILNRRATEPHVAAGVPPHLVKADGVEHEREVEGEDGDVGNNGEQHEVCMAGVQRGGQGWYSVSWAHRA